MPKEGTTVSFGSQDVPASGAYVLAVAVSPAGAVVPRLPVRAVGVAWVAGQSASHKLDVTLDAPATIQPKTTLSVAVSAAGAPRDEPVYVTLAAVDEAVLRMTDFDTPDPADHFVGRRAPGFELRDVYNGLIDPAGQPGRLTEGGDARAKLQMGGLDVKTFKTVALFKGPVTLDADGHGSVTLDIPDFSGRLRLMAVAWTVDRFGDAERPVTVRPPLLAELTLPRFLAPGDRALTRVMLTDLGAPEQGYRVTLAADGPIAFDKTDADFRDVKRDKRRHVDRFLTATGALGAGHIHMTVTGDDGDQRDARLRHRRAGAEPLCHQPAGAHPRPRRQTHRRRRSRSGHGAGHGDPRSHRRDPARLRRAGPVGGFAALPLRLRRADRQPRLPRAARQVARGRRHGLDPRRRNTARRRRPPLFAAGLGRQLRLLDGLRQRQRLADRLCRRLPPARGQTGRRGARGHDRPRPDLPRRPLRQRRDRAERGRRQRLCGGGAGARQQARPVAAALCLDPRRKATCRAKAPGLQLVVGLDPRGRARRLPRPRCSRAPPSRATRRSPSTTMAATAARPAPWRWHSPPRRSSCRRPR